MTSTDGRRARSEISRAAMLSAAVRVVATRGLAALTHRAVSTEIGVSPGLVTYHFPTVDALTSATLIYAGDRLRVCLVGLLDIHPDSSTVPELASDLAVHMVTDLRDETVAVYELMVGCARQPELRPTFDAITEAMTDLVEPLAGDRVIATIASDALLGTVAVIMARDHDHDLAALRARIADLIGHFDPSGSDAFPSTQRKLSLAKGVSFNPLAAPTAAQRPPIHPR